jgi:FAD/FMN-containing dehydrogenase
MKLHGWGRYPKTDTKVSSPRNIDELLDVVKKGNVIARGNGRAYGDCAVNSNITIHMKHFNHIIEFDEKSGYLVLESGVILKDIIETFTPRGWFPFVSPGTKFVSLGGMIASDVHGKNHHKDGSFGKYVDWIDIVNADGIIKRCSKTKNSRLFEWTIGGMGLTGIIVRAAIRLRNISSAWIMQKTLVAENIIQTINLLSQSNDSTYSVAWIDCLKKGSKMGRSLIMNGEHVDIDDLPPEYLKNPLNIPSKRNVTIPFNFPSWILNSLSVKIFNNFYFWMGRRQPQKKLIDWDSYFYPLDSIKGWNKIYGSKGFAQFQCVIPLNKAEEGLKELLNVIAKAGTGSFLAVLKRFGSQQSKFSFPMEGYTLALDFPISKKTLTLMDKLDLITLKYKGRFYLAKDSRMKKDVFLKSDQRAALYRNFRSEKGASDIFSSAQSDRLGL